MTDSRVSDVLLRCSGLFIATTPARCAIDGRRRVRKTNGGPESMCKRRSRPVILQSRRHLRRLVAKLDRPS
jgi:hypothetical protein